MINISSNDYSYYEPRSSGNAELAYLLATIASAGIMGAMPRISKPFLNQLEKEKGNNEEYKDAFIKSIEKSKLKDTVTIQNTCFTNADKNLILKGQSEEIQDFAIKAGKNACYIPETKTIKANFDTTAITGFHEAGHALNHLKSKAGKFLQHLRAPGYTISGLMMTLALFSRQKPKNEKRNVFDFIQDNSGKIAFLSMLPTVAEEALASYKGIKLARLGGLKEPLIKNLKKFYAKALLTYAGSAITIGLSVFAANRITENLTRPKKVTVPNYYL